VGESNFPSDLGQKGIKIDFCADPVGWGKRFQGTAGQIQKRGGVQSAQRWVEIASSNLSSQSDKDRTPAGWQSRVVDRMPQDAKTIERHLCLRV